jgi:hypothetical protein
MGRYGLRYHFYVLNPDGKMAYRISLESDVFDQLLGAKEHSKEAAEGKRESCSMATGRTRTPPTASMTASQATTMFAFRASPRAPKSFDVTPRRRTKDVSIAFSSGSMPPLRVPQGKPEGRLYRGILRADGSQRRSE